MQENLEFTIHNEPGLRVGGACIITIWHTVLLSLVHVLLLLVSSFPDTVKESWGHRNMLVVDGHRMKGGGDPRFICAC
jgi:hypothetical protein